MNNFNDEIKNGVEELDDDMLDGVAGGLVQLVNPSSSRLTLRDGMTVKFGDGRTCPTCRHNCFIYNDTNWTNTATCKQCGYVITGFTKYEVHYIET